MMDWYLDRSAHTFRYQQLIDRIQIGIQNGELLPGEKLPSERQLAQQLGIDRSTVNRAYSELAASNIVSQAVGQGTRIKKQPNADNHSNWLAYLRTQTDPLEPPFEPTDQASRLDLTTNILPPQLWPTLPPVKFPHYLPRDGSSNAVLGLSGLRHCILEATVSKQLNAQIDDTQILITSGIQQAFTLLVEGLLAPGDSVAIESPSSLNQLKIFQLLGIRIYRVPITQTGRLNLSQLAKLKRQHQIKLLFVMPNLQNPTGATMTLEDRKALVKACRDLSLPIVEGDPFQPLSQSKIPTLFCLDPDNVIYASTLSLLMGTQTRIGWLFGPAHVMYQLGILRDKLGERIGMAQQLVAQEFLCSPAFKDQQNQLYQRLSAKKEQLLLKLSPLIKRDWISITPSQTGFFLWINLLHLPQLQPRDYVLFRKYGLLILPAPYFGSPTNGFRLSFVALETDQQFDDIESRMDKALKTLHQKFDKIQKNS
ncbi:MAG: PLP-dependent aminotransferase family protein [Lentilactobacillus buchneri]|jgi:DNA-binding transcriptional MocR family regulator|nr:PLP-dependent aminotransferase family protein [Lentilactobacillus buchneri]